MTTNTLPSHPPVSPRTTTPLWKKLLIGLFLIAYVPFACEMFLRWFAPQPMLPRYVQPGNFGIRVNEPNRTYWQKTADVRVEVRINSQGMRADQDFAETKPAGTKRIVVLGDSFGMGYEVDLKDSFLEKTREKLVAKGVNVEILNLSVSGHGNAEQLLMLENMGLKFQPDLVLLAWHGTDLDDNLRSGLYQLKAGQLVQQNSEYLPGKEQAFLAQYALYRWMSNDCQLYSLVREKASKLVKSLAVRRAAPAPAAPSTETTAEAPKPEGPSYPEALTLALVDRIRQVAKEHGAQLAVLSIPGRIDRVTFRDDFPKDKQGTHYGWDLIDPQPLFEQHHGKLIFWERGHFHLTPLGCEIVAEQLANRLEPLLKQQ